MPPQKVDRQYVARLSEPIRIQTPSLTLLSALEDEEGAFVPHVHLKLTRGFHAFAKSVESMVLDACLAKKDEWFAGRRFTDDQVRASFKSLCKPGGSLKVNAPESAVLFDESDEVIGRDEVPAGSSVALILELSKVCFGRTEFGAMWTLVQARMMPPPPPPPRCLVDPSADVECPRPNPAVPSQSDTEVSEFF